MLQFASGDHLILIHAQIDRDIVLPEIKGHIHAKPPKSYLNTFTLYFSNCT